LIMARNPHFTSSEVANIIRNSADYLPIDRLIGTAYHPCGPPVADVHQGYCRGHGDRQTPVQEETEMAATRIRVTLRYVEILDRKDLDQYGEFVFRFKGSVPQKGTEQSVRIPESGHLEISDHPSMNRRTLDTVIFEGEVADGETLVLEATGEELDFLTPNDKLAPYRREFTGTVADWIGEHTPWDEGSDDATDPEQLDDWRFAFSIERLA
jgi:hypothetical protein